MLIGGCSGAIGGFLTCTAINHYESIGWGAKEKPISGTIVTVGAIGAGIGALLGGLIGAFAGTDETIRIEGKSDSGIQEILEKLRKKARVKNYQ